MKKYNIKSVVITAVLPFLVAGCAQLEKFGSYDETKFPYRFIAQDSGLIPDPDVTLDTTLSSCTKTGTETKDEVFKKDLKCKRDTIGKNKIDKVDAISKAASEINSTSDSSKKNELYLKMIKAQQNLWEYDFRLANDAVSQAITEHLVQRRIGEIKTDAFNLPILGGLVGIAASALYKASSESIGGLATGIGGLTATREYFNVEEKRDLHRNAAIGLVCLKTETARLYGLSPSVLTIRQSADELKDSLFSAINVVEKMSEETNLNDTDRQALSVQRETIDAAQKTLSLAERNLADYRDMPHRILTTANNLQANILVKGGRGEVNGGTVNPQIYSRFTEAAAATQKIGELRGQIVQAKAGKFVMETSPKVGNTDVTITKADGTTTTKKGKAFQGSLVIGIQNTLNSVENLGAENEMTKVSIRIAACGTPLQASQTP